jgi:hypothetical protein
MAAPPIASATPFAPTDARAGVLRVGHVREEVVMRQELAVAVAAFALLVLVALAGLWLVARF